MLVLYTASSRGGTYGDRAMAKSRFPKKTSKHFADDPLYKRLIYVTQYVETNREAAERLGISDSTLRRWKKYGIPERSAINKQYTTKINRVSAAMIAHQNKRVESGKPYHELRTLYYYRTFGGVRTKYWIVKGATYEQMLEILLRECVRGVYSGYSLLLEMTVPFQGLFDGESTFVSSEEIKDVPMRERRKLRASSSWIETTLENPFVSTRNFPLVPGQCHPEDFEDTLYHFYGMPNVLINEIRIKEFRTEDYYD